MFRPSRMSRSNRRRVTGVGRFARGFERVRQWPKELWEARIRTRMLRRVTWAMNMRVAGRMLSKSLLVTWCLLTVIGFASAWFAQSPTGDRITELQRRKGDLLSQRHKVRELSARLDALKEPAYRRQLRRQRLKMVCPNEQVLSTQ